MDQFGRVLWSHTGALGAQGSQPVDVLEVQQGEWWLGCWFRIPGWAAPRPARVTAALKTPDVCKLAWDQLEPSRRTRGCAGLCVPADEGHLVCPYLDHPNVRQVVSRGLVESGVATLSP